ncbi:MAG: glycosyltransferase family 4 protein [Candidatus Omnitrophota bacterium]
MKIAQVAPLYESVPPRLYGGTERVISYLTEELVKMGHDVVLYASGDSNTSARLFSMCPRALRFDKHSRDPIANHVYMSEMICNAASDYDIIHSHIDYLSYSFLRRLKTPHVTTLHGRLDIPNLYHLYQLFDDIPVVSISNYQRMPLSWINWQATVYHGLPIDLYRCHEHGGDYLAFIGRISPEKKVDCAIEIARRSGMPLKIAAKVDKMDGDYFRDVIKPLLNGADIEFIGEIGDSEKNDFIGNAHALLFPIDWPEPFGLVMIEAMACGTPVIAYLNGSVPEVMEEGITGFIVRNLDQAVEAVKKVSILNRLECRATFEKRFTSKIMAENYLKAYEKILKCNKARHEKRPYQIRE